MITVRTLSLALLLPLLAACGAIQNQGQGQNAGLTTSGPGATNTMTVEERLMASADRVSTAIRNLSLTQQAKSTRAPEPLPSAMDLPAELRTEMTVKWSGGAEEIVRVVADQIGYTLKITGRRHANGNFVTLDKTRTSVFDIFQDISVQLRTRAELVIDAGAKSIEIRYAAR